MSSGSISELADRLESKGLIARKPHPTDRRTTMLRATRRGHLAVNRALGPLLQEISALASELESNDRAKIITLLGQIHDVLAQQREPSLIPPDAALADKARPGSSTRR